MVLPQKQPPRDPDQLKINGNAAFKAFKLTEAIELYSSAVGIAPKEPIYLANRAAAHFEAGHYAECNDDVAAALELSPSAPLAAKLALRAARSSLWDGKASAARQWMMVFQALEQDEPALAAHSERLKADIDVCASVGRQANSSLVTDPLPLLRDTACPGDNRSLFASGHDKPRSMLAGALQSSACIRKSCQALRGIHTFACYSG